MQRFLWIVLALLAADVVVARVPASQARSGPYGGISGVIVDGRTGQPLPDAIVSITSKGRPVEFERQITDARGRFVFVDLPADTYFLTAEHVGYQPGRLGGTVRDKAGTLVLDAGVWRRDVSLPLFKPAVIAGLVVDEANEPVVGTRVRLLRRAYVAGEAAWLPAATVTTDDRGAFRFAGLNAGSYVVMVPSVQWTASARADAFAGSGTAVRDQGPEGMTSGSSPAVPAPGGAFQLLGGGPTPPAGNGAERFIYPATYFPAADNLRDATPVQVGLGEQQQISISLRPTRTWTVSGRLVGPSEAIANQMVRLLTAEGSRVGADVETAMTLVGRDGAFTFTDVPNGEYTIQAGRATKSYSFEPNFGASSLQLPPGVTQAGTIVMGSPTPAGLYITEDRTDGDAHHTGRAAVAVSNGDVTRVEIRMNAGITIRGRIVSDEPGTPVTRTATVTADPIDGDPSFGRPMGRVASDGSGTFVLEHVRPGRYFLRSGAVRSITAQGRTLDDGLIDATAGVDINDVVITTTAARITLSGVVRDSSGALAGNAVVLCFPADSAQWRHFGFYPPRIRLVSLIDGSSYTLGLPAGDYYVIALQRPITTLDLHPGFFQRAAAYAARVTLNWGDTTTQDLTIREIEQ